MVKTCGTCNWWDDNGVCTNNEVAICQAGESNTCPFWEEWGEEELEDLPMSENKKPRLAEALGVEVGEKLLIVGRNRNPYSVTDEGLIVDCDGDVCYEVVTYLFNHPNCFIRKPRWTEQEVEDAKNIIRLLGSNSYCCVTREISGEVYLLKRQAHFDIHLSEYIFPSLKCCETVMLEEIIRGKE